MNTKTTTKLYYIYKLTNDVNAKVYIGQTSDPTKRFQKCQYRARKIRDAIEEIGWEKFHANLLATTESKKTADALELDFIEQFDSVNNGYNSTYNTKYVGNKRRTAEARSKQRATMSTSRWYWNPKTDETIRIMKGGLVPNGFVLGRGGKMKSVRGHSLWVKVGDRAIDAIA